MSWQIRLMREAEIPKVLELVRLVFDQYEAPEYSAEGVTEFYKYIVPEEMIKRLHSDHFCLVAIQDQTILGMIEIRNNRHVSLLFVEPEFHGRSIGRQLWEGALQKCRNFASDVNEFTVNSSPFAVSIYEKFGFQKTAPEQLKNGLRFFPMKYVDTF